MRGQISTFWLPKAGATEQEYEDASANNLSDHATVDLAPKDDDIRVAVADGATESVLSGSWARALVHRVVRDEIPHRRWTDAIKSAIDDWPAYIAEYRDQREQRSKPIAWYEEAKLERGAEATLVALRLRNPLPDSARGCWWSMAVGDATIIQIRHGECVRAFPIKRSQAFDTSPDLIRSLDSSGTFKRRLRKASGDWQSGDAFFLCTDALAAWFLQRHEHSERPWEIWCAFSAESHQTFEDWVTDERENGRLKNDDVTLVRVDCY